MPLGGKGAVSNRVFTTCEFEKCAITNGIGRGNGESLGF
jgi:hypothetical protein